MQPSIYTSYDFAIMMTIQYEMLADCSQSRQSAKINSPPKFPALRYIYEYIIIYVYVYISVKMAAPWDWLTLLSYCSFVFTCTAIQPSVKYSRTLLRNTKHAQDVFERKQPEENRSNWPPRRLLFIRLEIVFVSPFTKRTKIVH